MRGGGGRLILLELAGGSSYAIAIYPNAHFPRCWFNEYMSEAGRDALGYYHERQDEKRFRDHDAASDRRRQYRPASVRSVLGQLALALKMAAISASDTSSGCFLVCSLRSIHNPASLA